MATHPVKQSILKNKLRVLAVPQHETQAVTVMLFVPVGSRFETPTNNGISHFLEHLFFKGTKSRPSTLEISRLLDGIGAEYNAYTSKDHTAYYIKARADHLELMLDLLSDMLFESLFDADEIDRERGVILEELNMYEDNPLMHIDTLLEAVAFHKEHPLGYDIGGEKKNIRSISRSTFMRFKKTHYAPKAMTLVLSGKLPKTYKRLVAKYFASYTAPYKKAKAKAFKPYQKSPQVIVQKKDTQQTQLAIGFTSKHLSYGSKKMAAARVLATILGGNMSSRLFIRVREREGLCYSVHAGISPYSDVGIFAIQAGIDNSRIEPALAAITDELQRIKNEAVTQEELNDAIEFIAGQTALRLEDSSSVASWYGKQFTLSGTLDTPEQKLDTLRNVTVKDVQRMAKEFFVSEAVNVALIGPKQTKVTLLKSLRNL